MVEPEPVLQTGSGQKVPAPAGFAKLALPIEIKSLGKIQHFKRALNDYLG